MEQMLVALDKFNDNSTSVSYRGPLYTRYDQILKQKNEKLE